MNGVDATDLIKYVISAGIGWLAALVTFRTKIALLESRATRLEEDSKKFAEAVQRVERAFNSIERRQLVQLQLSASIARKMGIDHRLPEDMLVRLLGEEDDNS